MVTAWSEKTFSLSPDVGAYRKVSPLRDMIPRFRKARCRERHGFARAIEPTDNRNRLLLATSRLWIFRRHRSRADLSSVQNRDTKLL